MNQIHIMRHEPVVTCDGRETLITGRQGELFRLLVLHNGQTVRKQTIATLRETLDTTASSKVRYLRNQLTEAGCDHLIENDRSHGYRAVLDNAWFVDAHQFRAAVEQLDGQFRRTSRRGAR